MLLMIGQLAIELHRIILSNLDLSTLRQCRLVQHKWTEICNEYFLPAVCFSEPRDFLRLLAIAQHNCIAEHVRSITFTRDIFGREPHWTGDDQGDRQSLSVQENVNLGDGDTRLLYISRLLHRFKRLEKLTVSDGRAFETIEWEWIGHNLTATEQFVVREDAVAGQLAVLQAAVAHASIHLDGLHAEWLDTKFFSSNAAEIGQTWKSLTVLRLGIVHDEESRGIEDLSLVLVELTSLRQLHLSSVGPYLTNLNSLVNKRAIAWNKLADLTLRRFVVGEPTLQRVLNIPSVRSISLCNICLEDDGCWLRIMKRLQKKKWEQVSMSGWLANITTDEGWGGDSNEDGDLLKTVTEWLMKDYGDAEGRIECPLTTENMNI